MFLRVSRTIRGMYDNRSHNDQRAPPLFFASRQSGSWTRNGEIERNCEKRRDGRSCVRCVCRGSDRGLKERKGEKENGLEKMAESRIYSSIEEIMIYFSRALLNPVLSFASFCRDSARRKIYHIEIRRLCLKETIIINRNTFYISITGSRLLMRYLTQFFYLDRKSQATSRVTVSRRTSGGLPFLLDQMHSRKMQSKEWSSQHHVIIDTLPFFAVATVSDWRVRLEASLPGTTRHLTRRPSQSG